MEGSTEKTCGTCRWIYCDGMDKICVNGDSDHCTDWVDFGDTCDEWEGEA